MSFLVQDMNGEIVAHVGVANVQCKDCSWKGHLTECKAETSEFMDETTFYHCPSCRTILGMQRGEGNLKLSKNTAVLK